MRSKAVGGLSPDPTFKKAGVMAIAIITMKMFMMIMTSRPESGQRESLGARSQLVRFTLQVAIVMFTWTSFYHHHGYDGHDDVAARIRGCSYIT